VYRQEKEQKFKTTSQEDLKYDPISTLRNRYLFLLNQFFGSGDILRRFRIFGSVHLIMNPALYPDQDPDPALFFSGFQDA
jgi:hypothetical protein